MSHKMVFFALSKHYSTNNFRTLLLASSHICEKQILISPIMSSVAMDFGTNTKGIQTDQMTKEQCNGAVSSQNITESQSKLLAFEK